MRVPQLFLPAVWVEISKNIKFLSQQRSITEGKNTPGVWINFKMFIILAFLTANGYEISEDRKNLNELKHCNF